MVRESPDLERNLALLPPLLAARSALFWLPVSFLYFESVVGAAGAFRLLGLYYLWVVVLEVPSGWASDALGRRATLVAAGLAQILGGTLAALGDSFLELALAQGAIAAGWALVSGTDTALLYDSLAGLGRESEVVKREARNAGAGFQGLAAAAALGGLAGAWSLRAPYALTAVAGLVVVACAWRVVEPPRRGAPAVGLFGTLRVAATATRARPLGFVLAFVVAAHVLNHVPLEYLQAYLSVAFDEAGWSLATGGPLAAGAVLAATFAVSAWTARWVEPLVERLGRGAVLALGFGVQLALVGVLAVAVHPALVPVFLARGVAPALQRPVLAALAHPVLESRVRATWFSAANLAGSLAFAATLWLAGRATGESLAAPDLLGVLRAYALGAAGVGLLLLLRRPRSA